ncbi:MAG: hypothetical protein FWE37_05165 [Spirochaetaceae bacterium]|nr:hypothetical protein [Spirochaetaceae bacterium]
MFTAGEGTNFTTINCTKQLPLGQLFTFKIKTVNITAKLDELDPTNLILKFDSDVQQIKRYIALFFCYKDVGYLFQSFVAKREQNIIKVTHSSTLLKRLPFSDNYGHIEAWFTLLNEDKDCLVSLQNEGFKALITLLTETKLSLLVHGLGQIDLQLKIRFYLNNIPLIICGKASAVAYNSLNNTSVLHLVNYNYGTPAVKEVILSHLYGLRH